MVAENVAFFQLKEGSRLLRQSIENIDAGRW